MFQKNNEITPLMPDFSCTYSTTRVGFCSAGGMRPRMLFVPPDLDRSKKTLKQKNQEDYPVKKTVFLVALCAAVALCVSTAMAQAPASLQALHPGVGGHDNGIHTPGAPKYCKPCLYYGGDWPVADSNWVAWANIDGGVFGGPVIMYSGIKVPTGKTWTVTALFSNNAFLGIDHFTPATPEWSINSGMKNGKAGKVVKKGKSKGTAKSTGRTCCSGAATEYTVSVKLAKAVSLKAGSYTEQVTPPCDSTKDSTCGGAAIYETDSYDPNHTNNQGANHFGPKPTAGNNFQNSSILGLNYQQVNGSYCTSQGYQAYACNFMSAGVVGTQK
jgi:hypothetical protein